LPRCVHAERLRVFRERDNEARKDETEVCLFEGKTKHRLITVKILAADITACTADVLVNPTDSQFTSCNDVAKAIDRSAGEEYIQQCVERINMHGPLEIAVPVFTEAGRLSPHVKKILHVVTPDTTKPPYATDALLAETTLTTAYYNCLMEADKQRDIQSIALPILGVSANRFDIWTAAHAAAKAVVSFDENSAAAPGALRNITFVNLTLSALDVMNVVFRQVLQDGAPATLQPAPATFEPEPEIEAQQQQQQLSEWFPIKSILSHQKRKGKDWYLVQWDGTEEKSWVKKQDVSETALQQFHETHAQHKRRRRD
jgi:O-acetyl-ADP-ribose deacetylase (regulator of RNase III)